LISLTIATNDHNINKNPESSCLVFTSQDCKSVYKQKDLYLLNLDILCHLTKQWLLAPILLMRIWRGESHFSQKWPLANVVEFGEYHKWPHFGKCKFGEYSKYFWRVWRI
jgi:hypothetical protein